MLEELVEIEKKTLQEFYNRVLRTNFEFKYLQLKFMWEYMHASASFQHLCESIKANQHQAEFRVFNIVENNDRFPLPEKYKERILLLYFIIEKIVSPNHDISTMSQIGRNYSTNKTLNEQAYFDLFNDLFLEPLIFYFLNQASRKVFILELLRKYKHRSEWFNKEYLISIHTSQTKKGEHYLKSDLYKYLFDSGLSLTIEPSSPLGEIDFIAAQKQSTNKVLAEGKIYDGSSRGKKYIQDGIWQLLKYLKDFNETEGYLIIYNIGNKTLTFNFNNEPGMDTNCILDQKRIYLQVIDLSSVKIPASKTGKPDFDVIDYASLNS